MQNRRIFGVLVAITLAGACGGGGSGEVIVLDPGDGLPVETFEGTFAADLNGDGLIDIVSASRYFDGVDTSEDRLNVFLQDPLNHGSFLPRTIIAHDAGDSIWQIVAADVTLDGRPEILLKSVNFAGFTLYQQDPADPGAYLAPQTFGSERDFNPFPSGRFDVGDIDGDLYPDVVMTVENDILYFRQDATRPGQFEPAVQVGNGNSDVRIGDLDGDGLGDLASLASSSGDSLPESDRWHYHRQNSSAPGSFFPPTAMALESNGWALGIADLNNDGRNDVAISSSRSDSEFLTVFRQTLAGTFERLAPVATGVESILGDLAIADLDGDAIPEVVVAMNTEALEPNVVRIYRQDGTAVYRPDRLLTIPDPTVGNPFIYAVQIADFNGDSQPDIVVSTSEIFVFLQTTGSPGEFQAPMRVAAQR